MNQRNIQWFPGHMTRTLRTIEKKLPLVDAVIQLLDARIPHSSLNPELQVLYKTKPRLYILNKSDLADDALTKEWLHYFNSTEQSTCVAINSKQKGAYAKARQAVESGLAELFSKRKTRGMEGAKTRLMITGIPNVGKSTFINNWAGGARTKTADKPGVTKGEQWITSGQFELLDMPGVLWKKFENMEIAVNLALIGSIPDRLLDTEELAAGFLKQVAALFPERLQARFKLSSEDLQNTEDGFTLLQLIGKKRGMLLSGAEVDTERASIAVLDEFRAGKLGTITLEKPDKPIN